MHHALKRTANSLHTLSCTDHVPPHAVTRISNLKLPDPITGTSEPSPICPIVSPVFWPKLDHIRPSQRPLSTQLSCRHLIAGHCLACHCQPPLDHSLPTIFQPPPPVTSRPSHRRPPTNPSYCWCCTKRSSPYSVIFRRHVRQSFIVF